MGNISNHDVFYSHPVLPGGREALDLWSVWGELPRALLSQGHNTTPEPRGIRAKGQGVLPAFVQIR